MDYSTHPHLRIIDEYLAGRLTAEDAAEQIIRTGVPPISMDVGPSLRPLIIALHKLQTGTNPPAVPPYVPDPNRHSGGGLRLVQGYAEQIWWYIVSRPQNLPLRLSAHLDATTKSAADRLAQWFAAQDALQVTVRSPTEAESDDWEVMITTPAVRWELPTLQEWEKTLLRAPVRDDASYGGLSVRQP